MAGEKKKQNLSAVDAPNLSGGRRDFVLVPVEPTIDMHVAAEEVLDRACLAMLTISKDKYALDVPTPSALACQVYAKMIAAAPKNTGAA